MSKGSNKRRSFLIKKKRNRRQRLSQLKEQYLRARDDAGRRKVMDELKRYAPFLTPEAYFKEKVKK